MKYNDEKVKEVKSKYSAIRDSIVERLKEFKANFEESDDRGVFAELSFCLLTPQSKARVCWRAVEKLVETGVLYRGTAKDILPFLKGIRFADRKADYIVQARENFLEREGFSLKEFILSFDNVFDLRDYLVKNIKGYGYKEASHFLRNIGMGEDIAILDRHILKNLLLLGVIREIPKSITPTRYFDIENAMREFSKFSGIPLSHLDFVLWSLETGEIFK